MSSPSTSVSYAAILSPISLQWYMGKESCKVDTILDGVGEHRNQLVSPTFSVDSCVGHARADADGAVDADVEDNEDESNVRSDDETMSDVEEARRAKRRMDAVLRPMSPPRSCRKKEAELEQLDELDAVEEECGMAVTEPDVSSVSVFGLGLTGVASLEDVCVTPSASAQSAILGLGISLPSDVAAIDEAEVEGDPSVGDELETPRRRLQLDELESGLPDIAGVHEPAKSDPQGVANSVLQMLEQIQIQLTLEMLRRKIERTHPHRLCTIPEVRGEGENYVSRKPAVLSVVLVADGHNVASRSDECLVIDAEMVGVQVEVQQQSWRESIMRGIENVVRHSFQVFSMVF